MKKVVLPLFLILSISTGAQVQSDCTVPSQLTTVYQKDIVQLATNYLFQVQSPDTIFVHLPQQTVDELSGGLAAILNAISIPERDSVFNLYCVHNPNGWPYDYAGFLVQVDTSYAWTQAWQNLVTVTGNAYMDSLTSNYALHVVNFYNWSFGNYAELSVDSAWNIMALMDSLSYTPGVLYVEQNGIFGQAGMIDYYKNGSDRFYDFYFEFNDCFDGCDNYHRWMFKVDTNCVVTYLGFTDWGVFGISPLPQPVNCNLFTYLGSAREIQLDIFPNPVSEKLTIRNTLSPVNSISIYNLFGQRIFSADNLNSRIAEVDCREFATGVYFALVSAGGKVMKIKFVKE